MERSRRVSFCRRTGFVLVLTLVLLALASLAMIAVSRAALARAERATEAQIDLQRRWGTLSCQAILLPKSELILHTIELQRREPIWSTRKTISLGDEQFTLVFGDESSKANVSTLIERQDREQAELTIRRLSLASTAAGRVHLRSTQDPLHPSSYGEIFESARPDELCDTLSGTPPAETLSCWGDGRLNIHRATETILREMCGGILNYTQIHLLCQLQKTDPDISLDSALQQLQLSQVNYSAAQFALTDTSNCYSLWIKCRSTRRQDWSLAIADQSSSVTPKIIRFQW